MLSGHLYSVPNTLEMGFCNILAHNINGCPIICQGTFPLFIGPEDPRYENSIKRWATNAEKHAGIVVNVASSTDVSAAVTMLPSCF